MTSDTTRPFFTFKDWLSCDFDCSGRQKLSELKAKNCQDTRHVWALPRGILEVKKKTPSIIQAVMSRQSLTQSRQLKCLCDRRIPVTPDIARSDGSPSENTLQKLQRKPRRRGKFKFEVERLADDDFLTGSRASRTTRRPKFLSLTRKTAWREIRWRLRCDLETESSSGRDARWLLRAFSERAF